MSELKRTERRHKLLAEVAAGRMQVRIGMQWNLVRKPDNWLSPMEKRTAGELRPHITHAPTGWDHRPTDAKLTGSGREFLAAWNADAGHVREATTPIDGRLVADCCCGWEHSVPEGNDEYEALERAHAEHVAEVLS